MSRAEVIKILQKPCYESEEEKDPIANGLVRRKN